MQRIFLFIPSLIIVMLVSGCKKGEDDPSISLRARKTRLAGEWRLQSGKASSTANNFNQTYFFDGTKFSMNQTRTSQALIVYVGSYRLSLNILKDGTFKMSEYGGGAGLNAEGTWNFNTGIGEEKKKEDVIFSINKVSSGYTSGYLFNRGATTFMYNIKELRNKKLVIHSAGRYYSNADGAYIDYATDYTFTQ